MGKFWLHLQRHNFKPVHHSNLSQDDGNHSTRQIRLHILRKDHRQETFRRNLELQVVPQDRRWRSIHCANTRRRCHEIDAPTIERDCGGLEGWAGFFRLAFAGVWDRTLRRVRVRTTKLLPRGAQNKAILKRTPSSVYISMAISGDGEFLVTFESRCDWAFGVNAT